ncbi:ABC transporter permease [Nocardiopsis potens]|uniref:ABC transporter permease n=1 Tax=Nocardiopsis potens TaxID=1246458 RepID=UPI00034A4CA8|nr:ABC transporter permease [Nocardiopsis potens]
MGAVRAEFLKVKRSLSWVVVLLLPVALVLVGTVNTVVSGERPEEGWHTLWLRSVVLYGLFPLTVGIGVLASLVWRVEHRGGNWNALMGGPTPALRIVAAKAAVVSALAAAMQGVMLAAVVLAGKLVFALPGLPPGRYVLISAVIAAACVPVAVLQSGLSMLMRSFAAPVAMAFLGAAGAIVLLMLGAGAAASALPYALVGRATQLGTGTFADTGALTLGGAASIAGAAALLTGVLIAASALLLDRTDARA